jgi:hypothetical protein
MQIPIQELQALVAMLEPHTFGYSDQGILAVSAVRRLARWLEEDALDGPTCAVALVVVSEGGERVGALGQGVSAHGALRRRRSIAGAAVADSEIAQ